MEQSPNLDLPYIMPSQAQKHVTHNEAIRMLDALVQLAVLDRDLTTPPADPDEGDRYIVAAGGADAWAGKDGAVAAWQDGAWAFLPPRAGWQAWAADEDRVLVFDGSQWNLPVIESLGGAMLGVNATADETNRLAVAAAAALFTHDGGDHRLVVNKAAAGDTASIVFQNDYSGRAEIGLAGDDRLRLKVSEDGGAFNTAVVIDEKTGAVSLPATPCGMVNLLTNGAFSVNQRCFAGGSLSAGHYGHDRWKAGAGGCSHSVAAGVVTHASGPLVQTIESPDLADAVVTLSVEDLAGGTLDIDIEGETGMIAPGAGRRGVTLTIPSVSTGNVAVTLTPAGGTVTYRRVQINAGAEALPFERRHAATELALCQRYYEKSYDLDGAPGSASSSGSEVYFCNGAAAGAARRHIAMAVSKRSTPTITIYNPSNGAASEVRNITTGTNVPSAMQFVSTRSFWAGAGSAQGVGNQLRFQWTADAEF